VRAAGRPHVAPVWFELDGDELVFTTGKDSVKGKNILRDPRVMISERYIRGKGLAITQRRNAASELKGGEPGLGWLDWRRIGVLRRFGGIVHVNPC